MVIAGSISNNSSNEHNAANDHHGSDTATNTTKETKNSTHASAITTSEVAEYNQASKVAAVCFLMSCYYSSTYCSMMTTDMTAVIDLLLHFINIFTAEVDIILTSIICSTSIYDIC